MNWKQRQVFLLDNKKEYSEPLLEKKRKVCIKRKEAEQKPNVVKQYFPQALSTISFGNDFGSLSISGQDALELQELVVLASRVPAMAEFMMIEKKDKKETRKGLS